MKIGMFGESDTDLEFQESLEDNLINLSTDGFLRLTTKFLKRRVSYEGVKRLDTLELWGRGTLKIIEECRKSGLPERKIEEVTGGISYILILEV